ncbi:fumarylacetoacetate hydrolase family protein [Arthrobacter sp. Br18]|uniref:fumarylacetoacetate hydrolase family protein n=1 Tax=Arthrobacter sp. Br18 TaxID=1312954 RepID=UPI00047E598B|nr:fumarylacetoacetate hydrolase family protein [Arthrobacter sp. Br18]
MTYAVPVPAPPCLPVSASDTLFPVRRVFCVGRNYGDHAREMGADPTREPPFFFLKPADAVFAPEKTGTPGSTSSKVPYPPQTADLHHEVELVVALGHTATGVDPADALDTVWGYGVGVDLTRRDLQAEAKNLRRPWDLAKGFDWSGPCSPLSPVSEVGHPDRGRIWLTVDGSLRQEGDLGDQIWTVAEIIAYLSRSVTLRPGDLIFTGTPAGVGALERGSGVTAGIDGVAELSFTIA